MHTHKQAKQLVKFGGGFYCGRIEAAGRVVFVINGFFMAMRDKYTAAGASITYLVHCIPHHFFCQHAFLASSVLRLRW